MGQLVPLRRVPDDFLRARPRGLGAGRSDAARLRVGPGRLPPAGQAAAPGGGLYKLNTVDPCSLKAPGFRLHPSLILQCDILVSNFAFQMGQLVPLQPGGARDLRRRLLPRRQAPRSGGHGGDVQVESS